MRYVPGYAEFADDGKGVGMKRKIVIVGLYLPGIYPSGEEDVVSRLLATSFLKAAALADPDIAANYDIEILDIPTTYATEDIVDRIVAARPDLIAYSSYIWNYKQIVESMPLVKRDIPHARIVVGGPTVSYTSEDFLRSHPAADIVICGSGEVRFNQLLKSDFSEGALAAIPRITYRNGVGEVVHTLGTVKEDLSIIPAVYSTGVHDLNDGRQHTVFLETFRGCPFSCGYCVWGAPDQIVHKVSMDNLLQDIEVVYSNPNVKVVFITDACIFYTRKRAKVIIDKIASCARAIPTVMTLDTHVLDEEMIEYLDKLNLYGGYYHFGLQSTNPAALELLRRPGGGYREKYVEKIALLRRVKPDAKVSFDVIYGLPGDNLAGFRETIDFAVSIGADKIHFSPLLLLPGTRFFNDRSKMGIVADDDSPYMVRTNPTFPIDEMLRAIDLVLWVNQVMYFPVVFNAIRDICRHMDRPSFVALTEALAVRVMQHVDPMAGITHQFTIEHNNFIRRHMMSTMTEPKNVVILYRETLELLAQHDLRSLGQDIETGLELHRMLLDPQMSVEDARRRLGWSHDQVSSVSSLWVNAT